MTTPPFFQPPMFRASPFKAMPPTGQSAPGLLPPGNPVGILATPGNAQVTVSWSPPVSNGGSPILTYTVTASPGGAQVIVNAPTTTATVTGLANGTTYTFSVTATNAVGSSQPAPAPFPNRLRAQDSNLLDSQNNDLGTLAGFNVLVATPGNDTFVFPAQDYLDMAAIGTRLIRHVLFWSVFQPTNNSGNGTDPLDTNALAALDTAIAQARAAGIYTILSLPHLNVGQTPTWAQGTGNELTDFINNGQFFTQQIAARYANELSVIGCDMNEPTNSDLGVIMSAYETYVPWWQAYAPQWPVWVSWSAYGGGTPTPHTGTQASIQRLMALDIYSRGCIFSWHDYLNSTGSYRNSDGLGSYADSGTIAPIDQFPSTWTAEFHGWNGIVPAGDFWNYPNTAQTRADFIAAQGPQVAFAAQSRSVVLAINEFGMDSMQSGEPAWVADKTSTFHGSGCVTELWWNYDKAALSSNGFAARPGGTWRPSILTWAATRAQNVATPAAPPPPTPAVNVATWEPPFLPGPMMRVMQLGAHVVPMAPPSMWATGSAGTGVARMVAAPTVTRQTAAAIGGRASTVPASVTVRQAAATGSGLAATSSTVYMVRSAAAAATGALGRVTGALTFLRQTAAATGARSGVTPASVTLRQMQASAAGRGLAVPASVRAPQTAAAVGGQGRAVPASIRAPQAMAATGGRAGAGIVPGRTGGPAAAMGGVGRVFAGAVRVVRPTAALQGTGQMTGTPQMTRNPAAALRALGTVIPAAVAVRFAQVAAFAQGQVRAAVGKVLPTAASTGSTAGTRGTPVRAPQAATAAGSRSSLGTAPVTTRQSAASIGTRSMVIAADIRVTLPGAAGTGRAGFAGSAVTVRQIAATVPARAGTKAAPARLVLSGAAIGCGRATVLAAPIRVSVVQIAAVAGAHASLTGSPAVNSFVATDGPTAATITTTSTGVTLAAAGAAT